MILTRHQARTIAQVCDDMEYRQVVIIPANHQAVTISFNDRQFLFTADVYPDGTFVDRTDYPTPASELHRREYQ